MRICPRCGLRTDRQTCPRCGMGSSGRNPGRNPGRSPGRSPGRNPGRSGYRRPRSSLRIPPGILAIAALAVVAAVVVAVLFFTGGLNFGGAPQGVVQAPPTQSSTDPTAGDPPAGTPGGGQDPQYQAAVDYSNSLAEQGQFLQAIEYLQGQLRNGGDSRLNDQISLLWSRYESHVLQTAANYAGNHEYRRAIQTLQEARSHYNSSAFQQAAADYRKEFGKFNAGVVSVRSRSAILRNADGTVITAGLNDYKQVSGARQWSGIQTVSAGMNYMVGLRGDGTVAASGYIDASMERVYEWRNVELLSAGYYHTVAMLSDGTLKGAGNNEYGQRDVDKLARAAGNRQIVALAAGTWQTLALLDDGTVIAIGGNEHGECNVGSWRDIVAIYAYGYISMGLKADGTVVITGDTAGNWFHNLNDWKNVRSLTLGRYFVVGILDDGTCVSTGIADSFSYRDVRGWTDVVCVAAGTNFTIGVRANGEILATGENANGQLNCAGQYLALD